MREKLFRGKRTDTKEWVYGYYFKAERHWHERGRHEDWILVSAVQNGGRCNVIEKYPVIPETVGQFTGLTDKNGKKVFEGDIVQAALDGRYYSVEYITDGEYAFNFVDLEKGYTYSLYDFNDVVVIGNIHDNPEMLNLIKGGVSW